MIAVLIPCYNEGLTIAKVVKDFRVLLPEAVIYVCDNNSTDNTISEAEQAGAIIMRETKQGKGNVVRKMFREIDADCYLMVDGDDTYIVDNAAEMARLVLEEDVDMVIGDRLSTTYFQENKRHFHNAGNKLVRWFINFFWKEKVNDIMTGYRAFSNRFVKLFPVMTSEFEIETEMTIHALDKRFNIKEIPCGYKDRPEGSVSKLRTFKDGRKVLKTIFSLYKNYRPIRFFGMLSLILILISAILIIPVISEYFQTGLVPRFPTLFVSAFLALGGMVSFFTGLCLDVIAQNERKNYELKVINFCQKSTNEKLNCK